MNKYKIIEGGIIMRSDAVKKGIKQAPHRSLFNALVYQKKN